MQKVVVWGRLGLFGVFQRTKTVQIMTKTAHVIFYSKYTQLKKVLYYIMAYTV